MAFSTSNIRSATMGNLKVYAGDWTGSAGDANGTITLAGGRVFAAHFSILDSDSGEDRPVPWSATESGGKLTVSVANRSAVTTGRFIIWYA